MVAIAQQSNLLRPRSNLKLSCICHRIRPHFCTIWSMNGRIVRQPPLFSQFRHNLQQNFKQTATSMPPLSRRGLKSSLTTSAILTKKKKGKNYFCHLPCIPVGAIQFLQHWTGSAALKEEKRNKNQTRRTQSLSSSQHFLRNSGSKDQQWFYGNSSELCLPSFQLQCVKLCFGFFCS